MCVFFAIIVPPETHTVIRSSHQEKTTGGTKYKDDKRQNKVHKSFK